MKLKYIGESYGAMSLTNGRIYEAWIDESGMYRVIDDSGEDYLYLPYPPVIPVGDAVGGRWEIIEE